MAADHERVGPFDTDYPGTLVVASRCCSVDRLDAPSQRSNEIAGALRRAAALPCPNDAAREAAAAHDVRRQAEKVEEILLRAARGRPA
jgi:hypothetical protein